MSKKILAAMMAMMIVVSPIRVKAAEVAQPVAESTVQFVELKEGYYYEEVEQDGKFQLYEGETLISSMQVKKSMFKPNATLTEGWAQYTDDETGKNIEGTFKEATLDTKGYLRCQFTPKGGSTVYSVCVKVEFVKNWATAQKRATRKVAIINSPEVKESIQTQTQTPTPTKTKTSTEKGDDDDDDIYDGWIDDEEDGDDEVTYPGWTE